MNEALLKVTQGPLQGQAFPVKYREVSIGRSKECKIRPSGYGYQELSREHARLKWDGSAFVIEDLGSRNGVLVDGQKVASARLRNGSRVALGDFGFELVVPADGPQFADGSASPAVSPVPTPVPGPSPAPSPVPVPGPALTPQPQIPQRGRTTIMLMNQVTGLKRTVLIGSCVGALFLFVGIAIAVSSWFRPGSGTAGMDTATLQRVKDSTVFILYANPDGKSISMGTGFLVDGNHIVTCRHVTCTFDVGPDGVWANIQPQPCKVFFFCGTDRQKVMEVTPDHMHFLPPGTTASECFRSDLCVMDLPDKAPSDPLTLGDSSQLQPLQTVEVVGFPLGITAQHNVSEKSLPTASAAEDKVQRVALQDSTKPAGPDNKPVMIQLGAAQTHGNSGGPIVDTQGNVVAVVEGTPEATPNPIANDLPTNIVQDLLATVH